MSRELALAARVARSVLEQRGNFSLASLGSYSDGFEEIRGMRIRAPIMGAEYSRQKADVTGALGLSGELPPGRKSGVLLTARAKTPLRTIGWKV